MDILFWIFLAILLIIGYKCFFSTNKVTENFYDNVADEFEKYKRQVLSPQTAHENSVINRQQLPVDPNAVQSGLVQKNIYTHVPAPAPEAAAGTEYAPIVDVPIYTAEGALNKNGIVKEVNFESVPISSDSGAYRQQQLTQKDLLPLDQENSTWAKLNPRPNGWLEGQSFLNAGYHLGLNTVGQTRKNANYQLRSEPPNPQTVVGPWNQSQIDPDKRRCFDLN